MARSISRLGATQRFGVVAFRRVEGTPEARSPMTMRARAALAMCLSSIGELPEAKVQATQAVRDLRTELGVLRDQAPAEDGVERPPLATYERALRAVQVFLDPPGVGARDTRECLLLQLDAINERGEGPTMATNSPGMIATSISRDGTSRSPVARPSTHGELANAAATTNCARITPLI